jgi:hypothetical protein
MTIRKLMLGTVAATMLAISPAAAAEENPFEAANNANLLMSTMLLGYSMFCEQTHGPLSPRTRDLMTTLSHAVDIEMGEAASTAAFNTAARMRQQIEQQGLRAWGDAGRVVINDINNIKGQPPTTARSATDDVVIVKGKLHNVGDKMAQQMVSVKNNRTTALSFIGISCGFFRGSELIDTGLGVATNVKAGENVSETVGSFNGGGADRAECHVDKVRE